jgi:hypothetical protein
VHIVVDNKIVHHAHPMGLHRMLSLSCLVSRAEQLPRTLTCILVVADIVVIEIAYSLSGHVAEMDTKGLAGAAQRTIRNASRIRELLLRLGQDQNPNMFCGRIDSRSFPRC